MSSDDQDVLFDILERNKVEEVKAWLLFNRWGKESAEVNIQPKSKSPLVHEPVISSGRTATTVSYLIFKICEELTWNCSWEELNGDICFVVTFFTKNHRITVDEIGT